jgi:iron complex transport system substrate-binding protein
VRRRLAASLAPALLFAANATAAEPPRRVASMNLTADEILVEILPFERLVAVTRWADSEETGNVAGRVPAGVFRIQKADMEQLVALRPDLVVVSEYTDADFLKQLERSSLRSHRMQGLATMAGIRRAILDLGRAVGEPAAAEKLVSRFDATLADLEKRLAGARRPRVLYWSNGMTAGADSSIGALIEAAGAVNVGRELGVQGVAPAGAERAFVADPDVILVGTWPRAIEAVKEDPLLGKARAVHEGRIVTLRTSLLVGGNSQYAAEACWQLAALLHPGRVPARRP